MQRNLADIFGVVVDTVPDREALVCGDRRLTYAALDERADRLAHHLADAGVGPGDHVAAYLYNGTEFVETMLAAFKLRAAVVNVNYRYVAAEVDYLLRDSDTRAVVYDTRFTATLAEVAGGLPRLGARLAVGAGDAVPGSVPYEEALAAAPPVRPLADALEARPGLDVSAVRVILNSGATVSPPVKDDLMARLPGAFVYDTFGSSESGTFAKSASGAGNTPTQGRFAPGDGTLVLDEALHPVQPGSGAVGRLARSGPVALGYYNDPEKTAATFPVIDGVRYIVTGDHATVEADGTVQVLGRGSACINTGGEKVYPDE